jgi:hypothetical protein
LFHLLVPGGKWQTVICRPVWSARRCSSVFQRRVRLPLEAPQSAVIVRLWALGWRSDPSCCHHALISDAYEFRHRELLEHLAPTTSAD